MKDPRWLNDAEDPDRRVLRQALDEQQRFTHSEVRQRRIWTRIAYPRNSVRATRRAFYTGAMAASVLTVFVVLSLQYLRARNQPEDPTVPLVADTVPASPTGADTAVLPPPAPLAPEAARPGDLVQTAAGERKVRLLRQNARAEVLPSSLLALDHRGRPEVRKGQVRFQVSRQPPGQHFTVRVGDYTAVVIGTRFLVTVQGKNVSVGVDEGAVEMWRKGRLTRVEPGQTWSGVDAGPERGAASAARAPETRPPVEDRDLSVARAETDPRRALELYGVLAQRTGPIAENALYEMGGIYHDKLRQPRQALASWERYRARYPRGLLRAEADLSIVDTLAGLGEETRALGEAQAFLKRYPQSERRGEIARVAGDLQRARGNCRAAVEFYGMALDDRLSSQDADDAAFGRAACLYTLGDADADAALRDYLTRQPQGRHVREARKLVIPAAGNRSSHSRGESVPADSGNLLTAP